VVNVPRLFDIAVLYGAANRELVVGFIRQANPHISLPPIPLICDQCKTDKVQPPHSFRFSAVGEAWHLEGLNKDKDTLSSLADCWEMGKSNKRTLNRAGLEAQPGLQ